MRTPNVIISDAGKLPLLNFFLLSTFRTGKKLLLGTNKNSQANRDIYALQNRKTSYIVTADANNKLFCSRSTMAFKINARKVCVQRTIL